MNIVHIHTNSDYDNISYIITKENWYLKNHVTIKGYIIEIVQTHPQLAGHRTKCRFFMNESLDKCYTMHNEFLEGSGHSHKKNGGYKLYSNNYKYHEECATITISPLMFEELKQKITALFTNEFA